MQDRIENRNHFTQRNPGARLLPPLLFLLAAWALWAPRVLGAEKPLHTYAALPGVEIQINQDGSLRFFDLAADQALLTGTPAPETGGRTKRSWLREPVFTARKTGRTVHG